MTPALLAALLLADGPATAPAEPAAVTRRLTLRELIAVAQERYPELAIVAAETEGAQALRSLAVWTRYTPRVTLTGVFGVVPAARGDIFNSPDSPRDLNDLGPFYRARVDASVPLWSFGRLRLANEAADAFVESKAAKAEAKRKTAASLAAHAWLGYLLAAGELDVIADTRKQLDKVIDKLDHPGEDDEPDPLDKLKARSYGFELDRAQARAERGRAIAEAGLRELVGAPPVERVAPAARELPALVIAEPELAPAIEAAVAADPELREARLAAQAKELYARSAGKERLPALAVDGRYEKGEAKNRDEQENPFVYEPFNVRSLAVTLGLRWDLNYMQTNARARKDMADAAELRAKADALAARTRVDVSEAHARLIEAIRVNEASRGALSTGANWVRIAEENYGLETASMKDLVDAYKAFVESQSEHLEALHALDLAVIDWRMTIGEAPLAEGEAP